MTPFERDITIAFETYRHNRSMTHLCVALRYDVHSRDSYTDPHSKVRIPATVDIFTLDRDDDAANTVEVMGIYKDPIVIMVDLRGPSLQEQIPGWKHGTIHSPAQFAENPVINLKTQEAAQPPSSRLRVFGVIDGGLSL